MIGVLRSLTVVGAGVGLVLGVAYLPASLNLADSAGPGSATSSGLVPLTKAQPVTQTQVICPGPEELGIAGLKDSRTQVSSVTGVAAPEVALPPGLLTTLSSAVGPSTGALAIGGLPSGGSWAEPVTERGAVVSGKISRAQSARVGGAGALAPGTVATQRSWITGGDDRGLFTAACMPAAASSWLIAGGQDPGRRERMVLTNPGPNPVTVDLDVLGAAGPIASPNGHGLVVGPYARTIILLDAISGSEPSPVVHVSARGGEVAAVLSDTWLDGVTPRGGDDAVPVAAPTREQVIAGVAIQGGATLRVAVPGDREAVVESRVLTPSGPKALPVNGVTRVAAHTTRDIDLSGLPPDAYAVQVRADVPVVAAATIDRRRGPEAPSDLAWSGGSARIQTVAGMVVRGPGDGGLSARLDLAATYKAATVLVTTVGADGVESTKEVAIAADSVSTVALDGGVTSVWVTPRAGRVRAAVVTWASDEGGVYLSVTPLSNLTLTTTSARLREIRD